MAYLWLACEYISTRGVAAILKVCVCGGGEDSSQLSGDVTLKGKYIMYKVSTSMFI